MFTKSLCLSFFCILLLIFTSNNSLIAQTTREDHCLTFDLATKTITVSCKNGTLSQARIMLNDNNVLEDQSNGTWLLKANLVIDKNSTFTIAPYDAKWLKIQTPFGVNSLGNLIINSVKLHHGTKIPVPMFQLMGPYLDLISRRTTDSTVR